MEQYDRELIDPVTGMAEAVARSAVMAAGDLVANGFGNWAELSWKPNREPVTEVDLAANEAAVKVIEEAFPDHNIVTEEAPASRKGSDFTWILDPIDGTVNYTAGIPTFCVSLALAWRGMPVLAAMYHPMLRELITARKGFGARLNGVPAKAGIKKELKSAIIGTDHGRDPSTCQRTLGLVSHLCRSAWTIRILGSAALGLAYVGIGRLDLYFHYRLNPWDFAAGWLIATEGGAIASNWGEPLTTENPTGIVAANPALTEEFLQLANSQGLGQTGCA